MFSYTLNHCYYCIYINTVGELMSDLYKEKRELISQTITIDSDTGEELSNIERVTRFPPLTTIGKKRFFKVWERAIESINDKHMYKFIKLLRFLEGPNQRLGYYKQGEKPIPLKKVHMAKELDVDPKTVRFFIENMLDVKGYFKFNGHFYVNPTFATRNRKIHTKNLLKMLELDPIIKNYIPFHELKTIDLFKRSVKL